MGESRSHRAEDPDGVATQVEVDALGAGVQERERAVGCGSEEIGDPRWDRHRDGVGVHGRAGHGLTLAPS